MSIKKTFLSSQDLSSPRSVDSRRSVFKIFSDTLRIPSKTSENRPIAKPAPAKINKKSPRTLTNVGFKQGFPSFHSTNVSGKSSRSSYATPFLSRQVKGFNDLSKKNGPGGSGEGNCMKSSVGQSLRSGAAQNGSLSMKDCHLNNVLRSATLCLTQLREAKKGLFDLVAQDEQLSRGIRKSNPTLDQLQLANVALSITTLCREAFIPAHRLNQTAVALYTTEDFLRYPTDLRTYKMQIKKNRIQLPHMTFNMATVIKVREVVDLAAATYNQFNGKGKFGEVLQEILFSLLRGYQHFYAATLGCQEIFKVLLYAGQKEKIHLQQFLLALPTTERSDLLVEIQDLRRIIDEIVIFLEKLSWGSFVIYRLAGGEHLSSASSCPPPAVDSFPASKSTSAIPANRASSNTRQRKK